MCQICPFGLLKKADYIHVWLIKLSEQLGYMWSFKLRFCFFFSEAYLVEMLDLLTVLFLKRL